jgi:hypothetical protein
VTQIVVGQDQRVADWLVTISNCRPMLFNMAIGLTDDSDQLIGGILFTGYNGSDVEVHYYGPGTLTRRIVRLICGIAVKHFNANRMTVRTRKKHMSRGCLKLGAVFEGNVKRLYGPTDGRNHAGKQYAFFREQLEFLAGLKGQK